MATRVAAWLAAAIFLIVAAFQAALVFGAPWGEYTQGGGTSGALTSSGRLFAAVSCVLSIVMAGAILARAGEGPLRRLPARLLTVRCRTLGALAQLGERRLCKAEVAGSIPARSIGKAPENRGFG